MENGNLGHRGGNGRPQTSEATVEQVRLMSENQPRQSFRAAASTVQVSHTIVHRILRRGLFARKKYKISMAFAAATKLNDQNLHHTFKITPLDIRNTYQSLYSPMIVFFV